METRYQVVSRAFLDCPDWEVLGDHVPIGKVYRIGDVQSFGMLNTLTGEFRNVTCGWDLDTGGWIPLDTMRLLES